MILQSLKIRGKGERENEEKDFWNNSDDAYT
jgi:hypothetical protein